MSERSPEHDAFCIDLMVHAHDGASHHHAVIRSGLQGHVMTRHGARDRWDWRVTLDTLLYAQQRHGRLRALADSLTPEQRTAAWSSLDPRAQVLRQFLRTPSKESK